MTLIERPNLTRRPTVTSSPVVESTSPVREGGRYVTSNMPQPATQGQYVTGSTPTFSMGRGTYVTTSMPTDLRGGSYTYSS
ncbi:hypothetical protein D6T63_09060 [Arthrobacter cheniae]|uniref:Uncharacterized protein n=1 Tax=Arthrobacter cheniae TaxID=1258888 RepID=A0A3A5M1X8_9MICC|nr:hypothetical protein [Arthrobacter cheniae]RJT80021.1 hypothetical protein D6T63_09060 [Arthrobacter cheniae]